jgi:hypothetical protein
MSSTTTTAAVPPTQKAERKAAAASANDVMIFQQTKFGRMRIPPFAVRLVVVIIAVPVILLAYVYRFIRRATRPRKGKTRESRRGHSVRTV